MARTSPSTEPRPDPGTDRAARGSATCYPVIHLTGTNGKGSTAAMIESLLADGLRTGRFTSPHVMSVTERISIDGEPISDERFDDVWREIEPYVALVDERQIDGVSMTFFEIITAMAYAAFADAPVDVAIVEVGLGEPGTPPMWPMPTLRWLRQSILITPTSGPYHHRDRAEKAGIIKPGAHAILAGQRSRPRRFCWPDVPRWGRYRNARASTSVSSTGGLPLPGSSFGSAVRTAQWMTSSCPSTVRTRPRMLGRRSLRSRRSLDYSAAPGRGPRGLRPSPISRQIGTRTPLAGCGARRGAQPTRRPSGRGRDHRGLAFAPLIGVVAVMADKDARGILEVFEEIMNHVVITQVASTSRGMPAEALGELAEEAFGASRVTVIPRLDDAIERAVALAEADVVGSPGC